MMTDKDRAFLERFDRHTREINGELEGSLGTRIALVEDIARYSLLGSGKRLRPLLFVLSSRLCGYEGKDVYHLSTIFEYIHTASLLHDDVLDNAETRRKKPSVRHVWGNSAALLGGDFLYSRASAIAIAYANMEVINVLNAMTTRMVEGQLLELEHTHDWHLGKDEYIEIIVAKTAALMSAACACGAIVAGSEKKVVERLSQFGLNLGIAFQLMDDMLDYTSSEEVFGKPVGKDLKEGKITLPLIYLLCDLESRETDKLEDLFKSGKATDEDYERLIEMVRSEGVIDIIRSEAVGYVERAVGFIDFFPESSAKEDLLGLSAYTLKRRY
ncbi:MAG: polyprenyl synthetase family protein [Desulfobacterales bacterium]|nr:polyprenyl synthetase family protein [Desulfobacterales bacterium]